MSSPPHSVIKKNPSFRATEEESVIAEDGGDDGSSKTPFPVVGIGASAGGLEAFTALLQHLPANTGMAFVLIQHLSPTHKSMLAELLEKKSSMPVTEVTDGMAVVPDHIYVIPPDTCLTISDGALRLAERSDSKEPNLPIDLFLRSLAQHQKNKAIAVILSGTASDGSEGIKVIKGYGGITFAQDDMTAQYAMMPKNAIATGCVDFVSSPERIAQELVCISQHPYIQQEETKTDDLGSEKESFHHVLRLLQKVSGVDFKNYKPTTLKRRILRRMMLNKVENFKDYVTYLIEHPKEIQSLSQDVFITVTRFFRDPEVFEALKQDVFPNLDGATEPIRVWVLGCSTGEEVYSLAINFLEFWEGKAGRRINFFATDIKDSSIESARHGIYPASITNDVSAERLRKFFTPVDKGYQINKSIREMCVFAKQNVTTDPPFSKIDLISCRNLLIYLDAAAQRKIIPLFHFALKAHGFLLLGQSENVASTDLFNVVNKKCRIYSKNAAQRSPQLSLGSRRALSSDPAVSNKPAMQASQLSATDIQREADRVVLKQYHHSGVVINESMEVLQFRGDTSRYLKHLPRMASLNILKMVQEGLFAELRHTIQKVTEENVSSKTKSLRIKSNGSYINVALEVIPFKVPPKSERYLLVTFRESTPAVSSRSAGMEEAKESKSNREDARYQDLEQELESTRLYLQGTIDAKESVNEELQAANEEILSTNEELQSLNEEFQSANEEVESAKEELQATNEEITTLNDELQKRNTELTELNDDHTNLMNSTNLPIIMVGRDLMIRRFTPVAEKVLRLIPGDVGRLISELTIEMNIPDLEPAILKVMRTNTLKEQEIRDKKGQWYKIQIRPYKTGDNNVAGALVTFLDISDLKMSQEVLREYGAYRDAIIQTVRQPLLILDSELRIRMANQSFYETFRVEPDETMGRIIFNLGNNQWNIPQLRQLLEDVLPNKSSFSECKVEHNFPNVGHKIMLLNARQIRHEEEGKGSILLAIEDITERKQAEDNLRQSAERFRFMAESMPQKIFTARPDGQKDYFNQQWREYIGASFEKEGANWTQFIHPDDQDETIRRWKHSIATGESFEFENRFLRADGVYRWHLNRAHAMRDAQNKITMWIGSNTDIEDRKAAEEKIKHYADELLRSNKDLEHFASMASHDLQEPLGIISMYTDLLRRKYKDQVDDAGREYMDHIVGSVHTMRELIQDLLSYSRVGREKKFKEFEIADVFRQATRNLVVTIEESGARTTCDELPRIIGDEALITQLFQNLMSNAIKFRNPNMSPEVHVSAKRENNDWIFSVKDNGIGIAPENHDQIFEIFSRLHSEYPGTGIGLALCKRIAEFHDGRIWVESEEGKGTTIHISLPQGRKI